MCVCVCVCVCVCACVCAVVSSQCHVVPCRFVQRLTLLDQDFRGAVDSYNQSHDRPVVSEETMQQILANVGSLRLLNTDFLDKLEERFRGWSVGVWSDGVWCHVMSCDVMGCHVMLWCVVLVGSCQ